MKSIIASIILAFAFVSCSTTTTEDYYETKTGTIPAGTTYSTNNLAENSDNATDTYTGNVKILVVATNDCNLTINGYVGDIRLGGKNNKVTCYGYGSYTTTSKTNVVVTTK